MVEWYQKTNTGSVIESYSVKVGKGIEKATLDNESFLDIDGAKWFVEHHVRGVGFDMQAIDHILYTYAADHGPGPYVPRICEEYEEQFGHPAKDDFPEWEPCHDILMANNVMGIENLGGDLDKVTNQRFLFCAFPLRWYMGDGTIVRAVAFVPSDRIDRSVPDKEYPYGVY